MPDLKPFEERSADHLRLVMESVQIGIWELDIQTGRAVRNKVHDEIFGYSEPLPDWTYEMFLEHVIESDRARVDELQQAALKNNRDWNFKCQIRTATNEVRWISAAGRPLSDGKDSPEKLIGHVIDITETKDRETRLQLITEELNHRVRNMLAMVKSIVRMSASSATDIPSLSKSLEGRVGALARTHDLLVAEKSMPSKASAILKAEISAFPELSDRLYLKVRNEPHLPIAALQGLALVFHELLTNALKYGAFSNQTGHVDVSIFGGPSCVSISWRESNGPQVKQERDSGFGSKLISRALGSHGSVDLVFSPDGVECHIVIEL